ncbi:MAG: T9SS type A sorting domain-containing protein, partial [candidate division WOR-3 bacterium]
YMQIEGRPVEGVLVSSIGIGAADTLEFPDVTLHGRDSMGVTAWTYLSGDQIPADDTLSQKFLVRVKDVAVSRIMWPGPHPYDTLPPDTVLYPRCQVWNLGNQSQTFNVQFRIGAYENTVTVSNLLPGGARYVTALAPYTTVPGVWIHTVEAVLAGDLHPENNVMQDTFWVLGTVQHDVAAEAIVSPVGNIDTIHTVHCRARVANYGGDNETFWTWFSVTDTCTDRLVYRESLQVSLPGGLYTTVSFPDTVFKVLGTHTTKCSVYVAGDQNALNDVVTGSFQVTAASHNVLVEQILAPVGTIDSASVVTPSAVVRNSGSEAETFNAFFKIGSYIEAFNVQNLAAGASRTLTFPDWTAHAKDTVQAVCWTYLVGDENPADDTLKQKFFVAVHDVGVAQVLYPVDTVPSDTTVYPACVVKNYGSATETFDVQFRIGMYEGHATVTDLDPGKVDTVEMVEPYTTQVGVWLDRVNTLLVGDQRSGNNQMLDTFWVLGTLDHDVGIEEILAPSGTLDTMESVEPKVKVANYGQSTETWKTWFRIYDPTDALVYDEWKEITLPGQASVVLTYPETQFRVEGEYTSRCSTYLETDQNWTNNVAWSGFEVGGVTIWQPGWKEMKSVPSAPSTKPVKDGAWLAIDAAKTIYAGKGYKTGDFYAYDAIHNTWKALESIPSLEEGKVKLPYKGACGVSDGGNYVYLVKGNNTLGFWRYDVGKDTWERLPDVPLGPEKKRVKGGTDVVYVDKDDTGYVYLLKGYKTEFYRYNTVAQRWDTLDNVPYGQRPKYDKGSWLCLTPGPSPTPRLTLYAHQAKFLNSTKTNHFMFRYDVPGDTWYKQPVKGMPYYGLHSGRANKKKKSKDGSCGTYYEGYIYALKGGNTQQFFRYTAEGDTWYELDTMPSNGTYGRKKFVKYGGDIVTYGYGAFFALKGNKTFEFWRYVLPRDVGTGQVRSGVQAGQSAVGSRQFVVSPNPLAEGFATVRFSLAKPGPAMVTVFDIAGRAVLRQAYSVGRSAHSGTLDCRKLAGGVYLVRLDAEGYTATQKLVVQR